MNMRRWDDDFPYFKRSTPREARGGIKAQSKRGDFGQSWWAKRWITVLESFNIGARLSRGRSYARRGQVLSVEIDKGKVDAKVQGSRPAPYHVELKIRTLSAADWKKLAEALSREALFAAKLLGGEMPPDIERTFKATGLSLFPERSGELETSCSCPDWSNPCKHIAAVYYLLGEEFDRDPFLIFKLRGTDRETLMKMLRPVTPRPQAIQKKSHTKRVIAQKQETPSTSEVSKFWNGENLPNDFFGEVSIPSSPAALPKKLGSFPFWRGRERFLDAMETIYSKASPVGLNVFLGERPENDETHAVGPMNPIES
jgi:uncharacterized Zn finger protein